MHELVPVLTSLGVEPEIAESFYGLPVGSTVVWHAHVGEREMSTMADQLTARWIA
jgi:hypothetical protein